MYRDSLEAGDTNASIDPDDFELSVIRSRLGQVIPKGTVPDMGELCRLSERVIVSDLERAVAASGQADGSDYAVFTGVQIHAPGGQNYVWPAMRYVMVDGILRQL